MAFDLTDKWVWDFWFAVDGDDYHMFYLQSDRKLHPDDRHWHVSIGHAISQDLNQWQVLPDAIAPSPMDENTEEPGDTKTTWTGSVIKEGDLWYLFYTGGRQSENGLIQRVCLATSHDLITWQKHPANPLIGVDTHWYDSINLDLWHDESWRDPWVFKDEHEHLYHMLITCRVNKGEPAGRGAIGYASSRDLIHWEAGPPIFAPGLFGEMEVPQVALIGGRYYLFCSVSVRYHASADDSNPQTGLKYFPGTSPLGPFSVEGSGFLGADTIGSLYAGKVIQGPDKHWYFMAFRNLDSNGNFVSGICSPKRIEQNLDGSLSLAE